jgi:transposase
MMENWTVIETLEDAHDIKIIAGRPETPDVCPRCGIVNPRLHKHDQQEQTFMDTPMHGKRVGIQVIRQRYRCLDCGKTFQQLLPEMDEKRNMTKRLLAAQESAQVGVGANRCQFNSRSGYRCILVRGHGGLCK